MSAAIFLSRALRRTISTPYEEKTALVVETVFLRSMHPKRFLKNSIESSFRKVGISYPKIQDTPY